MVSPARRQLFAIAEVRHSEMSFLCVCGIHSLHLHRSILTSWEHVKRSSETLHDNIKLFSLIPLLRKRSALHCKYPNPLRTKFHNTKGKVSTVNLTLCGCPRFREYFTQCAYQVTLVNHTARVRTTCMSLTKRDELVGRGVPPQKLTEGKGLFSGRCLNHHLPR